MKNSADNAALRERFDRAVELNRQGRTAQAVRILESLRKRYPDHPAILGYLGGIFLDQNRLPEAASAFKRATELAPRSELASVGLFHTLWAQGDRRAARAEMGRFLALSDSKEYRTLIKELGLVPVVNIREPKRALAS